MGDVRKCDARCHRAVKPRCFCWCGGVFHGAAGAAAREAFKQIYSADVPVDGEPRQGELFDNAAGRFRAALGAARAAPRVVQH